MIPEYPGKLAFIANDLVKTNPAYVTEEGLPDDYHIEADPHNLNVYNLDQIAIIAKLTQASRPSNR